MFVVLFKGCLCKLLIYDIVGFFQFPMSVNTTVGENVSFSCSYPNAIALLWRLNNTTLRQSTNGIVISEDQHTLTILALAESNMTQVRCVAFRTGQLEEVTCPAYLLIQGVY